MKNAYEQRYDAERYDKARTLPAETKAQLMGELSASIKTPLTHVVDLGCGTGRFTAALADAFSCPVTGIEPSKAMLEVAKRTHARNPNITLKQGSADAIPLEDATATLVFMSQVYHHLPDKGAALTEIGRVLTPQGFLAIRNATQETNDSRKLPWLRFFPKADKTENARMPTQQQLIETVTGTGFKLIHATVIEQLFASSPKEYAEKIGGRGLSALVMLDDEAFEAGMNELRLWAAEQPGEPVHEPVDLFVFQRF